MSLKTCKAFLCPSAAGHSFRGGFASLALALLPLFASSCALFEDANPEPDNVSPTRSQLIAATGGFICLYREGANPVDLLYVKSTANEAGFQVVYKIAESSVIPEAIRKGWGDVAVARSADHPPAPRRKRTPRGRRHERHPAPFRRRLPRQSPEPGQAEKAVARRRRSHPPLRRAPLSIHPDFILFISCSFPCPLSSFVRLTIGNSVLYYKKNKSAGNN